MPDRFSPTFRNSAEGGDTLTTTGDTTMLYREDKKQFLCSPSSDMGDTILAGLAYEGLFDPRANTGAQVIARAEEAGNLKFASPVERTAAVRLAHGSLLAYQQGEREMELERLSDL
jgi:hypothetical protein